MFRENPHRYARFRLYAKNPVNILNCSLKLDHLFSGGLIVIFVRIFLSLIRSSKLFPDHLSG